MFKSIQTNLIALIIFSLEPFFSGFLSNVTLLIASKSFSKSSWIDVGSDPYDKIFNKVGFDTK